jgi:hypothetical protein
MPGTLHFVCAAAFSPLHCNMAGPRGREQTKRPPETSGPCSMENGVGGLFGRDLPRRIQRPGIVNLRHLMIGKAEHLAQDFVGMFPE